jgi:hypothetical protein
MENKKKKDLPKLKKVDTKPTWNKKGAAFPVRHGKLGAVVTR